VHETPRQRQMFRLDIFRYIRYIFGKKQMRFGSSSLEDCGRETAGRLTHKTLKAVTVGEQQVGY